jgi:hypothetical protein
MKTIEALTKDASLQQHLKLDQHLAQKLLLQMAVSAAPAKPSATASSPGCWWPDLCAALQDLVFDDLNLGVAVRSRPCSRRSPDTGPRRRLLG